MNVRLVYPVPVDNWPVFQPFVKRFCDTYRQFKPYGPHIVQAVVFGQYPVPEVWELFEGMPVMFTRYDGGGMDIGAAIHAAKTAHSLDFMVNFTSRAYFWRPWLENIVYARLQQGPGIYGMSASHEGGKFHICTRGYCLDACYLQKYPTEITSRDQGVFYELGDGCITEHVRKLGGAIGVVNNDWRPAISAFDDSNGFRQGDQSGMLVLDRHTDLYRDADPQEKARLQALMLGKPLP